MKKTLFALTVLALTAGAALAQTTTPAPGPDVRPARPMRQHGPDGMRTSPEPAKSPARPADRRAARMAKSLGLSADQEAKVEGILLARRQDMNALKAKYAGNAPAANRRALRPEAEAIRAKYDEQLRAVLGADLYARYDQQRDERADKARPGRGPKDGKRKLKVKS